MRAYRLVDWDQTIPMAHDLFEKLSGYPDWISQIRHYLIDEYQDFNRAEQAFITRLRSIAASSVIVGDDNQSLYSGRGGSPDGLRQLYSDAECDQATLVKCRRCKSQIVEAANAFMTPTPGNSRRMEPHEAGGELVAYLFKSSKAEVAFLKDFLARSIQELPETAGPKDGIVCLFPSWRVLDFYYDQIAPELPCAKRKGILNPTRLSLERVLRLIARPNQRFLERLILEEYSSIKPRHKKDMLRVILERDISPTRAIETMISEGAFIGPAAEGASQYVEFCSVLSSREPDSIADALSPRLKQESLTVRHQVEEFIATEGTVDQDEAIRRACDALLPESAVPPEDLRTILFLTIHGAKGLTKKTVVMPGLEEAWLPGAAGGDVLEERRRMFYVALTRATDYVLITAPRTRARGDPLNYATPGLGAISPFVVQAGIHCTYHA
jgi:DNA helicase-2/ATP-dependent DNA helicase PcrA